ncbi:MAG: hypothetical protein LBQ96_08375 [Fusobacteriaceae bacterium]|jgi:antitoxin component YwqK of YwqJK toxin-antitoxin module|nr:hypothetical protein [Fusobacteriaceae bacterium]
MKKILLFAILAVTILFGAEIKKEDLQKLSPLTKIGDAAPFTGTIKEKYPSDKIKYEIMVQGGRIETFRFYSEDGNMKVNGYRFGRNFTGSMAGYTDMGMLVAEARYTLYAVDWEKVQPFFLRLLGIRLPGDETEAHVTWDGRMKYTMSGFDQVDQTRVNNEAELNVELKDGILTADGKSTKNLMGQLFYSDYESRIEGIGKIDFSKFFNFITFWMKKDALAGQPSEMIALFKDLLKEFFKLDGSSYSQTVYDKDKNIITTSKSTGTLKKGSGSMEIMKPYKLRATYSMETTEEIDLNVLDQFTGPAEPYSFIQSILKEFAKINADINLECEFQGKNLDAAITHRKGKIEGGLRELLADGKPGAELTFVIPDIKTLDFKSADQADPSFVMKVLRIGGKYKAFDESGKVTEEIPWNADSFKSVALKAMQRLQNRRTGK